MGLFNKEKIENDERELCASKKYKKGGVTE